MKVLLGVTGSVATILTPKLIQALENANHEVRLVSTQRGMFFLNTEELCPHTLVDELNRYICKIYTDKDEWPANGWHKDDPIKHIDLGTWADLLLIAPLSADTLSDIAHGKADKFLTSIVLAWNRSKPVLFAPAMNTNMWINPITQTNLKIVDSTYNTPRHYKYGLSCVINPIVKKLACGTIGIGAMANISDIVNKVNMWSQLQNNI